MAIDTPCIGICSTVYGDDFCRGCKRHFREVINWNALDEPQKHLIILRLETNITRVMKHFVDDLDETILMKVIKQKKLRHSTQNNLFLVAFYLLRDYAGTLTALKEVGIFVKKSHEAYSPIKLFNEIDLALYQYSGSQRLDEVE